MRRVANELGAGTMTLYHYVRNKEDLLALVDDAIMGEVLVPEGEMPDSWRDALREIAQRSREVFRRHPWRAVNLGEAHGGPNSVRHFDQSLAAVESTGLSERDRLEIIAMVDDYVLGNSVRQTEVELPAEEWTSVIADYLGDMLETGEFKHVEKLVAGDSPEEAVQRVMAVMRDQSAFDRGLERLLDGIELFVKSKKKKP